MVVIDKEEMNLCKKFIKEDIFLKRIHLRYFHGYQTYIQITGDTNSGKSILANWIHYLLTLGMYEQENDLSDYYFSVLNLAKNIDNLENRCIMNDEAGKRGKNWNDAQNELWRLILETQRIKRNTYIDCIPHRKEVTGTTALHINFLIVVENIIADFLDAKDKIEDYKIIRIANVFKYQVDYLGFDQRSIQNSFVFPYFVERFIIPDFATDKRFTKFWKFIQEDYKPFEKQGKQQLAQIIKEKAESILEGKTKRKMPSQLETSLDDFQ